MQPVKYTTCIFLRITATPFDFLKVVILRLYIIVNYNFPFTFLCNLMMATLRPKRVGVVRKKKIVRLTVSTRPQVPVLLVE